MGRVLSLSESRLQSISDTTGHSADLIEKVLKIEELLQDIFRHPFLRERLVLKGGTGLNFCYFNKPRLSVDIDLNYIGAIDIENMKRERPKIDTALMKIFKDKEYTILREPGEEHAGGKYRLRFNNIYGDNRNVEFDINYLFRVPIGEPEKKAFKAFDDSKVFNLLIVSKEELFAGKVVAALDRATARDIYDVANISDYTNMYDKQLFRASVILFGVSKREDFRKVSYEKLTTISEGDIENELYPLLPRDKRIQRIELLDKALPFVSDLLGFTLQEKNFLDRFLDNADYKPEILFAEYPKLVPKLHRHPAVLWKRLNVERYLKRY